MWLTVKINWGLYTQLKSTVNRFIPPKKTHRPEMLIAPNATSGKRNKLRPDVCVCEEKDKFDETIGIHTQPSA